MSLQSDRLLSEEIRALARQHREAIEALYRRDPRAACRSALRLTRHVTDRDRLAVCDSMLAGHGTEAIRGAWQNGYWCDVLAEYVNMGDTYAPTVIRSRGRGDRSRFWVGDLETLAAWADRRGGC